MTITREDLEAGRIDFSDVDAPGSPPMDPIHPGEILLEDFMKPLGLSARGLARALKVPHNRLLAIINGKRAVSADTALRLARYFGGRADWWLDLQGQFDLEVARREHGSRIMAEVQPKSPVPHAA